MATIKEQVAEKIAGLGPAVQDAVVNVLVEQVKTKRVQAILSVQNLIEEAQKELKKIKPDQQSFGADNKLVSETYSKSSMEKKKQLEEKITKLEAALALALDPASPNFEKLFNLANNKGNAPAEAPAATE